MALFGVTFIVAASSADSTVHDLKIGITHFDVPDWGNGHESLLAGGAMRDNCAPRRGGDPLGFSFNSGLQSHASDLAQSFQAPQ